MKHILLLLSFFLTIPALARTPPLSPEQTVRQIYHSYEIESDSLYFGDTTEKSLISTRMKNVILLNDRLTLPGDIGWLDSDPLCDCQEYDHLVLENITIHQTDVSHADATVQFRPFKDSPEAITQTLKLIAEGDRWLIDDIISPQGSLWQAINSENQKTLASLRSLQRERPQHFVRELFNRLDDYSWPWTWVVSAQYRQAVNDYSQTAYKNNDIPAFGRLSHFAWPWRWTTSSAYRNAFLADAPITIEPDNDQDTEMETDKLYFYANPIFFGKESQFARLNSIQVIAENNDRARIHVRFTLTDSSTKVQDLLLHRTQGQWEIEDFIRPDGGSLLKAMQQTTRRRLSTISPK
ncbi:DUF3828 domain-containing protein [Salmonella enterica]|nr:DUF3828 domain-containing protein [Salmonella enterica]